MNVNVSPHSGDYEAAPTIEYFNARVDELLPLIEKRADEADELGYLTDDVVAAFREAGLWTMLYPKEIGGAGLSPIDVMRVCERIGYAHGSTGWVTAVYNAAGAQTGIYLEDEAFDEIFADGANVLAAGNGNPRGLARPVDGGYMIKGRWAYGSGLYHTDWVQSGCFITDDAGELVIQSNGQPKGILCTHPREAVELLGNWDVLGLLATGSVDYTIKDAEELFVPTSMTFDLNIDTPYRGGALGTMGIAGFTAWGHTAWALGVGRRVLDELAKVVNQRVDAFGKSNESASFKFQFAQAESKFRAARALAIEAWQSISDTLAKGEAASLEQMTMAKMAFRHSHDVISDVGTFAHKAARGASLHKTTLQRFYRDIHAGTQHVLMHDGIEEEVGRALLGQHGPDAKWTVLGVAG